MKQKKRLGKGIEDIAHFFISREPQTESDPLSSGPFEDEGPQKKVHRVVGIMNHTPGIPGAFWASHIAQGLSNAGKKSLLVDSGSDFETLTSLLDPVSIQPSLNELLNQEEKTITSQSPDGYQVLSFQVRVGELYQFKPEERDILFQILCREEEESDFLLINMEFDLWETNIDDFLKNLNEVILVITPKDLVGAYSILKMLFQARPDLSVRLLSYGSIQDGRPNEIQRLIIGARQFLGRSPSLLGKLDSANLLAGVQHPKRLFRSPGAESLFRKQIADVCDEILKSQIVGQNGDLFFERVQSQMDLDGPILTKEGNDS